MSGNVTCPTPRDLHVVELTDTTATLEWIDTVTHYDWTLEYGEEGYRQGYGHTIEISNHDARDYAQEYLEGTPGWRHVRTTLRGLTPGQAYHVYLYANCGLVHGISSFSNPAQTSFLPDCPPADVPYYEDFDSYTVDVNGQYDYTAPYSFPNHKIADCWQMAGLSPWVNGSPYSQVFLSTHGYAAQVNKGLMFKNGRGSGWIEYGDVMASLPVFNAPLDTLVLRFNYRNQATDDWTTLQVGYTTNVMDPNAFVVLDVLPKVTSFTKYELDFSRSGRVYPEGARMAIRMPKAEVWPDGTRVDYAGIDSVSVTYTQPCYTVQNLRVVGQPESSVSLAWDTIANVGRYMVVYGRKDFAPGTGDTLYTSLCHITVPGLTLSATYDFYVSSQCAQEEVIERPATMVSARPGCGVRSLPYYENFDDYSYDATRMMTFTIDKESLTDRWYERPSQFPSGLTMPACWQFPNQCFNNWWPQTMMYRGMYAYGCYDSAATAQGQCLMMRTRWDGGSDVYAAYSVLPRFERELRDLTLEFDLRYSSHWDTCALQVGYMTDVEQPTTFVPLMRTATNCTTYTHYRYDYSQEGLQLPEGAFIAFKYKGNYEHRYLFVDNVHVYVADTCRMVQDVRFEKISDDTTLIGWTMLPEATNYRIVYGRHGFPIDTGNVAYVLPRLPIRSMISISHHIVLRATNMARQT